MKHEFRIWDEELQEFIYTAERATLIEGEDDFCISPCFTMYSFNGGRNWSEGIFQQWSGMFDIKWNKIYFGDIVELHYANQPMGFGRFLIGFDRGAFIIEKEIETNWFSKDQAGNPLTSYNICKIIGNNIQNPELL